MNEYIQSILDNQVRESDNLEFKKYYFENGKFNTLGQKESATLVKEICSFANHNGGKIIIGIQEDGNHNPNCISDCGVSKDAFETWEQSFRNKIATTTIPALYGITLHHVTTGGNNCIVIDVQRSILKPHAFNTGSRDEFYIRNGNESRPMRYNDIKNGFNSLEFTQEKMRRFRDNRISYLLSGELDSSLSTDSFLVVHIIPEWSLDEMNFLDLRRCKYNDAFVCISPGRKGQSHYNADGLIDIYGYEKESPTMSYIQIFPNGTIEATEIRLLNLDNTIYKWNELESIVIEKIYEYCMGLYSLEIKTAFSISVSILNAKGKRTKIDPFGGLSNEIKTNLIKTPFVKWSVGESFQEAVFPILTTLAYTFGQERSYFYDENLNPRTEKFNFLHEFTQNDS